MILGHRTYTLPHGTMDKYLARYEAEVLPIQKRHLGKFMGLFVAETGLLNQVISLWAYESLADREQCRRNMDSDPAWHAFRETNRGAFLSQEVKILRATSFSPQPA